MSGVGGIDPADYCDAALASQRHICITRRS